MTPVVRILLVLNVAVFFLQQTVMPPPVENALAFVPRFALVQPWSAVTYMFLHGGLMHLLFNMIALFFFGPRVEERLGSGSFTALYFVSGITGALLSLLLSPGAAIIGASAGVYGVMLAFAWFWPDAEILIWGIVPVKARMLVILTTIFALLSGFGGAGGGIAHFAHLGGYVGAFAYLKWRLRGRTEFKRRVEAPAPEADRRIAGWRSIDKSRIHEANREEVDRILDKISAKGIHALTPQERTFLSNFVPPDDRVPPVS